MVRRLVLDFGLFERPFAAVTFEHLPDPKCALDQVDVGPLEPEGFAGTEPDG